MNNLKLYYWNGLNFGDKISPYIVEKLSGVKTIYRKTTLKGFFHQLIDSILIEKSIKQFFNLIVSFFSSNKIILGVGSIADISNKKTIVWGAGFMIPNSKVNSGKFVAVRGKLSGEIILKKKLATNFAYGDPAILLPLIYPKLKTINAEKIGIVPHIKDFTFFANKYQNRYKIVNLADHDIESVINQFFECSFILSSSLHGIIVAHAYGIRALWVERVILEKTGFKFHDYFSSVGIPKYNGFRDFENLMESKEKIIQLFNKYRSLSIPTIDIGELQKELINCAPFKVLSKYQM
jgi:hypothetical protein